MSGRLIFSFFLILITSLLLSQKELNIDSLRKVVKALPADSNGIKKSLRLIRKVAQTQPQYAIEITDLAMAVAEKSRDKKLILQIKIAYVNVYENLSDFKNTLKAALSCIEQIGEDSSFAYQKTACINAIGNVYLNQGNYNIAIDYYLQCVRIAEKNDYGEGLIPVYNNIGLCYFKNKQYKYATTYFEKALVLSRNQQMTGYDAMTYYNKAGNDLALGSKELCVNEIERSIKISDSTSQVFGMVSSRIYLAAFYIDENDFEKAGSLMKQIGKIIEQTGFPALNHQYNLLLGKIEMIKNKNYRNAAAYFEKSESLCLQTGDLESLGDVYKNSSRNAELAGDKDKALAYYKKFKETNDSIYNESSSKYVAGVESFYENEKKENEINLLNKESAVKDAEIEKQGAIRKLLIAVSVFMLAVAGFVFYSYRQKKKTSEMLQEKNELITRQKAITEEKQKEILDSIRYARRIQTALLTSEKYIERNLKKLKK